LILNEIGNATNKDYFNIGSSADIVEYNSNHATVYYTSTMTFNNINYTHINVIEVIRFVENGKDLYRTVFSINRFRDKSNDAQNLGRIGLSAYQHSILLTMEK
jgi:hypothetical protein